MLDKTKARCYNINIVTCKVQKIKKQGIGD